ncbi:MAG TPA: hypothetical protein DCM14_02950 [Clostridiales bacterium UBA8153]|nr:hypothetical protein [Clostridiales bacterium UBA8153]
MPLDAITAHIRQAAQKEQAAIAARAEADIAAQQAAAAASAQAGAAEVRTAYAAEAQALERRVLTLAQLEARRRLLEVRRRAVEEALSSALTRLSGWPDRRYLELLQKIIVDNSQTGREELVLNAADRARLTPDFLDRVNEALRFRGLPGGITLAQRTAAISGGCILAGTEVEINASFDAALKTLSDDLEPEVAATLLGDRS